MKLAIATCLAALSLASTALAEVTVTATLDKPQPTRVKFIAADAVWDCQGATCVAQVAPDTAQGVTGCKDLAKQVGNIQTYSTETRTLDAKGLERCNASLAPTATASR
jgi:hypothetical protein